MKVNKYGIDDKHMRHIRAISEDEDTITVVFNKNAAIEKRDRGDRHFVPTGSKERRTFDATINIRAKDEEEDKKESRTVEGYAAVFNTDTDMGWWKERIAPGAFSDALSNDVRALFNHDPNLILARTNNTLELWEDEKGLGYRFEAPNTTMGDDLLENIRNGNITQSSFGFTIDAYEWEDMDDDTELITITKVGRLYDVSPVTFPAYETTEVTARSIDKMRREKQHESEEEGETEETTEEIKETTGEETPDTGLEYIDLAMAELTPPDVL